MKTHKPINRSMLIVLAIYLISWNSWSQTENKEMDKKLKFPTLVSESLAGQKVRLPGDIKGKVALVTVAFFESGQPYVDSWAEPYLEAFYSQEDFDYFEVPMISDMPLESREYINSGMRAGIPKEMHPNVVTFYGDYQPYLKALKITDLNSGYAFLVDSQGTILYRGEGMMTAKQWQEMRDILRSLP